MLETILKLYTMSMADDIRSPLPHLVGPPGCGKSTSVEQAAELIGCNLHIINVSRISPLELEGVQMPVDREEKMRLMLLHSTMWTALQEGDIVLLDEFLRGFPEVYNGLLDILTSRQVSGFKLPKVFIIAASNSVATYDKALEDRLLHLPVADPRSSKRERNRIATEIIEALGLVPGVEDSYEMNDLLNAVIHPMYALLDQFKGKSSGSGAPAVQGTSPRKLIGQAKLRQIEVPELKALIEESNRLAAQGGKWQYYFVYDTSTVDSRYLGRAQALRGNPQLTDLQALNLELNLQLLELEAVRNEKEGNVDDDEILTDDPPF